MRVRALVADGWLFERGTKHGKLLAPDGKAMVVVSTTPGDRRRSLLNFERDVRRALRQASSEA